MRGDMATGSALIDWGHSVMLLSSLTTTQFFKRWKPSAHVSPFTWHWVMNTLIFQLSSPPWPFTSHPISSFPPLVYLCPACGSWLTGRSHFWGVTNLKDVLEMRRHSTCSWMHRQSTGALVHKDTGNAVSVESNINKSVPVQKHHKGRHFDWKLQ